MQEPIAAINDPIAQSVYIQQLSERIGIAEAAVLERIRSLSGQRSRVTTDTDLQAASAGEATRNHPVAAGSVAKGSSELNHVIRFERQIIAMMIQFPEVLPEIRSLNVLDYFETDDLKSIGRFILKHNPTTADQVSELISKIETEAQQTLIASLAIEDEAWNKKGCLRLLGNFVDTRQRRRHSSLLEEQIKAAEKRNDHKRLLALLNEKQKMAVRSEKQEKAILND